jgi:hypothetical protein
MDFIKVQITKEKVNLRDAPSMSGKVVRQVNQWEVRELFAAAGTPIANPDDNSEWYELFFEIAHHLEFRVFSQADAHIHLLFCGEQSVQVFAIP